MVEGLRIAGGERRAGIGQAPGGVRDVRLRRVDPDDRGRRGVREEGLGERAGAAADVEPAAARRHVEPVDELARHEPAPPPDVALEALGVVPDVRSHRANLDD